MKNNLSKKNLGISLVMALLLSTFLLGGTGPVRADYGPDNAYGYHDRNGDYHRYGYHNDHRGYWNHRNGVRFWINVG